MKTLTIQNIEHLRSDSQSCLLIETDIEVVDCVALRREDVIIFTAIDASSLFGGMVLHPAVKITVDYCRSRKFGQSVLNDGSRISQTGMPSSGAILWPISIIRNGPRAGEGGVHTNRRKSAKGSRSVRYACR